MKICFVYSNRAEYSLLMSFIDYFQRLENVSKLDLSKKIKKIHLDKNLHKVFQLCYNEFSSKKYDYVIVVGDRRELMFMLLPAFFLNIKIVHVGAGEYLEGIPTYDQFIRPAVSIFSNFQICFSKKSKSEVIKLFSGISNLKHHAYFFGNPVLSNINLKKLKRPIKEKYDIVLLHPQSLSRKNTEKDIVFVKKCLRKNKTVFISGNKDRNNDLIEKFYNKLKGQKLEYKFYESLPKEKYLSLVKYCEKLYTNTSSIAEIKALNKKCLVTVGARNKNRNEHVLNIKAPSLLHNLLKKDFKKK